MFSAPKHAAPAWINLASTGVGTRLKFLDHYNGSFDLGIPLIRLTFPIFDRHHHHRFPVWGYAGGLRVLVTILDKILDVLDVETAKTGISFDLVR